MPIYLKQNIEPYGEIGIWKIEEDVTFFLEKLTIYKEEQKSLDGLKNRKLMEWASSRYLLHVMSGREHRGAILKDEYGKPYLVDSPFHISLSHSKDLTAIVASPYLVGIDIQYFVNKITRIAPKFVNKEEFNLIPSDEDVLYYHFIWGAKECLFKAYGKGQVDFKKHLKVYDIVKSGQQLFGKGDVIKDDFQATFRLNGFIFEEYILVYAIQQD